MFQISVKKNAPEQARLQGESGDGGNRTRVRKIRAPNIYERSPLLLVRQPAYKGPKLLLAIR